MPALTLTLSEEDVKKAIASYVNKMYPKIPVVLQPVDIDIAVEMVMPDRPTDRPAHAKFKGAKITVDEI